MIKVTSPGAAQEVWINPEHVTKLWQRVDGITMLRFVNGETLQILEKPDDFIRRIRPDPTLMPTPIDNSYLIANAIKDQSRQFQHLNVLMDAYLKSNRSLPHIPMVPYVST